MTDERGQQTPLGEQILEEHVRDCVECEVLALPVRGIAERLASYAVPIDAAALSRRVLEVVRPDLARLASVWFWRRLARVILTALVPLPVVLVLNAVVLSAFHAWVSEVLPAAVATYLVVSYAALLLLLFASTYAAIPLVLARDAWARAAGPVEVLS